MRWFLAILILVNGMAFYWFSGQSSGPGNVVLQEEQPQLLLLSERTGSDMPEGVDAGLCVVIGPVVDTLFVEWLGEELAYVGVDFESWSEVASPGAELDSTAKYWLQFSAAARSSVGDQLWLDIEINSPQAKIVEKTCTTVASSTDFP